MTRTPDVSPARNLPGLAAVLDALAALFSGLRPDECALAREHFAALAREAAADRPELAAALDALAAAFPEQGAAPEAAETFCAELEAAYVRLFVSAPGGVPAPPYASCHGQGKPRLHGPEAEAMQARLDAAGLIREAGAAEPPDHLAVELAYLVHLLEAPAVAEAAAFARDVMLPWTERFGRAVEAAAPHPAFAAGCAALAPALRATAGLAT